MQTKVYNAYRLTHKDGSVEDINALDMVQALENMDEPETESRVIQAVLVKENVRTLVEDAPRAVSFTAVVASGGGGSIATPAQGSVHSGDQISLQAIPARNYAFRGWLMNGSPIGRSETLLYTVPALGEGYDDIVFTAEFALADVAWSSAVEPAEASAGGCLAFPFGGTAAANGALGLLACAEPGWEFVRWERNGEQVGDGRILSATVEPLAQNEERCVYTAVFKKADGGGAEGPAEP